MKTIWKYQLRPDVQTIMMPEGAEVLSVDTDPSGFPCAWALVDDDKPKTHGTKIVVFGTGHPIPDDELSNSRFLGTFVMRHERLVFHAFEITP